MSDTKRNIVTVPIANIHPDPFQPRLHPDADLADSIRSQGILQIFSVEELQVLDAICPDCGRTFAELNAIGGQYMIRDGERRWRGATAAGVKEADVEVVPPMSSGRRLLRQVTFNLHKPLTPIELGLAYKSIMEEEGWSQAQLAKELGVAKSTVGDRIRLVELDRAWLDLIAKGELQISHAPFLHPYAAVPPKYQAQAAKHVLEEWVDDITNAGVPVEDFRFAAQDAFRPIITPLSEVSPEYSGPVIEMTEYGSKRKFAADPDLWRPIVAEKAKRAREKEKSAPATRSSSSSGSSSSSSGKKSVLDQFPDLPKRKATGSYEFQLAKGEVKVWTEQMGWDNGFMGLPAVFLAKVDRSKLTGISLKYAGGVLVTSDADAVTEARAAFNAELKEHIDEHVVELIATIAKQSPNFRIAGPGARTLLESIASQYNNPLPMLARALNVKVEGLKEDQPVNRRGQMQIAAVDADILATAYIATLSGAVKVKLAREISTEVWRKYSKAPVKFPASKNQEKRDARAAGKQVGDPSRASKVDVGSIRAAVEAGLEHEALTGAGV
jgi:ParB/RepB/Spo0J family partition protein